MFVAPWSGKYRYLLWKTLQLTRWLKQICCQPLLIWCVVPMQAETTSSRIWLTRDPNISSHSVVVCVGTPVSPIPRRLLVTWIQDEIAAHGPVFFAFGINEEKTLWRMFDDKFVDPVRPRCSMVHIFRHGNI